MFLFFLTTANQVHIFFLFDHHLADRLKQKVLCTAFHAALKPQTFLWVQGSTPSYYSSVIAGKI